MKILRFDSVGGASGDMILNALLELCERQGISQSAVEEPLHALIPEHFHLCRSPKGSHGMWGKTLVVDIHEHEHEHHGHHEHEHHHAHRSWADIRALIENSTLPENAKALSLEVFRTLAEVEGNVHGKPAEDVHFHEVGAVDSIIDIVGCCLAYTFLNFDGISVSPLPTGEGMVHCAHGVYPLPAPATQALLERFKLPVSQNNERCEMLTPTGAALLAVWKKIDIPGSAVIGETFNSFGHREMESRPNVLRVTVYESISDNQKQGETAWEAPYLTEDLIQFETNLDDVTGEQLGATMTSLFAHGALDVWFTPVTAKKQRPGIMLGVLSPIEKRAEIINVLFKDTTTFGVREFSLRRHSLKRRWEEVETSYGIVRVKIGTLGGVDVQFAPEFDDCQRVATTASVPVSVVFREVLSKTGW